MIRMLLALLALLTGLAAPVGSAQARIIGSETEIGASECRGSAARNAADQVATGQPVQARKIQRKRAAQPARPQRSRVLIPSVQLGIDRAHE